MWNIMLAKLFNNFIKHQKVQVSKHWGSSTMIFKMNSTDINTKDFFTPEEEDKILNIINLQDIEDLLQYSITKKHARSLKLYCVKNGPYHSLEDLLQVKGINKESLHKFYKSIVTNKKETPRRKKEILKRISSGLVVTPKVTTDNQKDVNTVLGIHVGLNMISWSLLTRDCEVLQWDYKFFPPSPPKKNIHSLLQTTLPIAANFPKADRYIMQEFDNNSRKYQKIYQINVEQSVRNATIMSYLATMNSRFDTVEFITNNIFTFHQNTLQKFYGLVIGTESISTQYTLQTLLEENKEPPENKESSPTVYIKPEFQDMYNAQSAVNKEQISWSLLIALAFVELIVHDRNDKEIRNIERMYHFHRKQNEAKEDKTIFDQRVKKTDDFAEISSKLQEEH